MDPHASGVDKIAFTMAGLRVDDAEVAAPDRLLSLGGGHSPAGDRDDGDDSDEVPEEDDGLASAMALGIVDAGGRLRQLPPVGAASGTSNVLRSLDIGVREICRRNEVPGEIADLRSSVLDQLAESVFQALYQRRTPWIAATLLADNGAAAFAATAKLRPSLVTQIDRLRASFPPDSSRLVGLIQSELDFSQAAAVLAAAARIDPVAAPTRPVLHIFGSSGNKCGGASSDVDIAIEPSQVLLRSLEMQAAEKRASPAQVALGLVETVVRAELVPGENWYRWQQMEYVRFAKVPVLKLGHANGVRVDLCFNNLNGVRNTALLRTYVNCDPRVRPLILAVKEWAKAHGLNEAGNGFFSSYSHTLLVIFFLQHVAGVLPSLQDPELLREWRATRPATRYAHCSRPGAPPAELTTEGRRDRLPPATPWDDSFCDDPVFAAAWWARTRPARCAATVADVLRLQTKAKAMAKPKADASSSSAGPSSDVAAEPAAGAAAAATDGAAIGGAGAREGAGAVVAPAPSDASEAGAAASAPAAFAPEGDFPASAAAVPAILRPELAGAGAATLLAAYFAYYGGVLNPLSCVLSVRHGVPLPRASWDGILQFFKQRRMGRRVDKKGAHGGGGAAAGGAGGASPGGETPAVQTPPVLLGASAGAAAGAADAAGAAGRLPSAGYGPPDGSAGWQAKPCKPPVWRWSLADPLELGRDLGVVLRPEQQFALLRHFGRAAWLLAGAASDAAAVFAPFAVKPEGAVLRALMSPKGTITVALRPHGPSPPPPAGAAVCLAEQDPALRICREFEQSLERYGTPKVQPAHLQLVEAAVGIPEAARSQHKGPRRSDGMYVEAVDRAIGPLRSCCLTGYVERAAAVLGASPLPASMTSGHDAAATAAFVSAAAADASSRTSSGGGAAGAGSAGAGGPTHHPKVRVHGGPAPGLPAPGFPAPGFAAPGFAAPGFSASGYSAPGFSAPGLVPAGFGPGGYPVAGHGFVPTPHAGMSGPGAAPPYPPLPSAGGARSGAPKPPAPSGKPAAAKSGAAHGGAGSGGGGGGHAKEKSKASGSGRSSITDGSVPSEGGGVGPATAAAMAEVERRRRRQQAAKDAKHRKESKKGSHSGPGGSA